MRARALPVGLNDRGAATIGRSDAAQNSTRPAKVQIVDDLSHPLRPRRHELAIVGQPQLATSSLWRWASAERWAS
jgi:hypothetical protein